MRTHQEIRQFIKSQTPFVSDNIRQHILEVKLAQMAIERAQTPRVKEREDLKKVLGEACKSGDSGWVMTIITGETPRANRLTIVSI